MAESIVVTYNTLANNSFAYCCNNVVNETDHGGNLILAIIKKLLIGFFKGFFKQLCIDFILWVFKKKFNKSSEKFKPSPTADYISSVMTAILNEFKLSNIIGMALSIIAVLIKYIPKIISGKMNQSEWGKLLVEVTAVVLTAILTKDLNNLKTKRTQIRNKMADPKFSRNLLRIDSRRINLKIYYIGVTLNFWLPISESLTKGLLNILFK